MTFDQENEMPGNYLFTTVRLSWDVVNKIKTGQTPGDTYDDVLRDLLGMPPTPSRDRRRGRPRTGMLTDGDVAIQRGARQ